MGKKYITLDQAAELAEVTLAEFKQLLLENASSFSANNPDQLGFSKKRRDAMSS